MSAAQQYIAGVVAQGYSTGAQIVARRAWRGSGSALQRRTRRMPGASAQQNWRCGRQQADKTLTFEAGKTNQGKSLQELEMYNKAFLSEAHLIAQQLVSMLNNLRAGSSATLSVIV